MTLAESLVSVWQQVLVEKTGVVRLEKRSFPVDRTRKKGLRTVDFSYGGHEITGIEQNPRTQSRWAQMAREGKPVMQFSCKGRYIGVVADGQLTRYGAWEQMELPD
ncbi:MAG TPA: hypothetical protein VLE48_01865 [Terriglobales bacterium]|nr:hypothetical protein [Terriglobales bacterium]